MTSSLPDRPQVSCIIPAYENLALFSRCVLSALTQTGVEVEVIVSDDSRTTDVEAFCAMLKPRFPGLIHIPGARTGNPVQNWNNGLNAARGRYCIVLHHDEFLLDPTYLARAATRLDRGDVAAVTGRSAVIGLAKRSRAETVRRIAAVVRPPIWLLHGFNWIGSTACVVFRSDPTHRFDDTLQWFVDVDFYLKLMKAGMDTRSDTTVSVGSIGHHANQISAVIDINGIARSELKRLTADGRLTPFRAAVIDAINFPRRLLRPTASSAK